MSLRKSEDCRARAARQPATTSNRIGPPSSRGRYALADSRVMTFAEWCGLNGFSQRTGWRIIQRGDGPIFTQLSEKRVGVTIGNNRAWQKARERSALETHRPDVGAAGPKLEKRFIQRQPQSSSKAESRIDTGTPAILPRRAATSAPLLAL